MTYGYSAHVLLKNRNLVRFQYLEESESSQFSVYPVKIHDNSNMQDQLLVKAGLKWTWFGLG